MRLTDIEHAASERLEMTVQLSCSESPLPRLSMSPGELAQLETLSHLERRRDWLTGRAALKALLRRQGRGTDTSTLRFPASNLSLTHAGGIALATGTDVRRIGIDYEELREVHSRMAAWFLDDAERAWLAALPETQAARQLVRLWTIKEAAFKCHPGNNSMVLGDFSIVAPASRAVVAVVSTRGLRLRVHCREFRRGYLSVAGVMA